MRSEIQQYNLDWMLWRTFGVAAKTLNCSEKEIRHAVARVPYFKDLFEYIISTGEAGKKFIQCIDEYLTSIITAHEQGKKRCATTFCFNPAIFHAMDIVPVTLEMSTALATMLWSRGTDEFMDYCNQMGFTETSCSSQRGALGAYLAGLAEPLDFIVCDSPGVCDTNANAFAFAAEFLGIPFYQLDYPPALVSGRSVAYHRDDFLGLIAFLEKQVGRKLDIEQLRSVIEEIMIQDKCLSDIEDLQMLCPNPLPVAFNVFIYGGRFLFTGLPVYTEFLKILHGVAKENADRGLSGLSGRKENARALFCYIDHYASHMRLFKWLDSRGVSHIGNVLSRFFHHDAPYAKERLEETYYLDTSNIESMIQGLAELNARSPMIRTIRGPYDHPHMWRDDVLSLAKLYRADCIVYVGTPGCRNTWGMVKLLAADLEKAGYPTHIIHGDAFDRRVESWERTSEKLEEFFYVRGILKK